MYFEDELKISSGIARLYSNSVWGAIRGIETFSQLTFITDLKKVNFFKKIKPEKFTIYKFE